MNSTEFATTIGRMTGRMEAEYGKDAKTSALLDTAQASSAIHRLEGHRMWSQLVARELGATDEEVGDALGGRWRGRNVNAVVRVKLDKDDPLSEVTN